MAGGNELEPNDSRNVTGTAHTPDGRWSGDKPAPSHGGELEPADSRNVTGTASTPDGRWTNDRRQAGNESSAAREQDTSETPVNADGIPQTGEEDALAEVSTESDYSNSVADLSRSENRSENEEGATREGAGAPLSAGGDDDDSIEPSRIPGSAEDITVAGVTGPGPSG